MRSNWGTLRLFPNKASSKFCNNLLKNKKTDLKIIRTHRNRLFYLLHLIPHKSLFIQSWDLIEFVQATDKSQRLFVQPISSG